MKRIIYVARIIYNSNKYRELKFIVKISSCFILSVMMAMMPFVILDTSKCVSINNDVCVARFVVIPSISFILTLLICLICISPLPIKNKVLISIFLILSPIFVIIAFDVIFIIFQALGMIINYPFNFNMVILDCNGKSTRDHSHDLCKVYPNGTETRCNFRIPMVPGLLSVVFRNIMGMPGKSSFLHEDTYEAFVCGQCAAIGFVGLFLVIILGVIILLLIEKLPDIKRRLRVYKKEVEDLSQEVRMSAIKIGD